MGADLNAEPRAVPAVGNPLAYHYIGKAGAPAASGYLFSCQEPGAALNCYTPQELATAYDIPSKLTGAGQTIVIIDAFGDPTNLNVRSSAMATCALTLRYDRATGTATFPMHYRDPALVGHAGGLYQVIPVGIFQPSGEAAWNEENDFDLWRGLLREYAEELLGESEEYGSEDAPIDYAAWPLARAMTDALATGQVRAYCLGLGTDPLTFAMDLLAVVVIDAPLYDELFGALVADNAEGRVIAPRVFDEAAIKELTTSAPLQAAASALLTLAYQHRDVLLA